LGNNFSARQQCEPHSSGEGENFFNRQAAQKFLPRGTTVLLFDVVAGVFEQFAVFHATGAGGFARPAAEAEINMPHRGVAQRKASVLHGAHEIDAAAGRVVFVARFQIGWARRQAQPAMDAGERLVVVEEMFGLTWVLRHASGVWLFGSVDFNSCS
jgi:hypothetical protein